MNWACARQRLARLRKLRVRGRAAAVVGGERRRLPFPASLVNLKTRNCGSEVVGAPLIRTPDCSPSHSLRAWRVAEPRCQRTTLILEVRCATHTRTGVTDIMSTVRTFAIELTTWFLACRGDISSLVWSVCPVASDFGRAAAIVFGVYRTAVTSASVSLGTMHQPRGGFPRIHGHTSRRTREIAAPAMAATAILPGAGSTGASRFRAAERRPGRLPLDSRRLSKTNIAYLDQSATQIAAIGGTTAIGMPHWAEASTRLVCRPWRDRHR